MREVEVGVALVVQLEECQERPVTGVVEDVAEPGVAVTGVAGLDVHEREPHRLGVEAVRRRQVAGGDGDVMECPWSGSSKYS